MTLTKTTLLIVSISAVGGVLYGFDIGVVSGALIFMKPDFNLTPTQLSLIVAAVLGGGSLSILFTGHLSDAVGRRPLIIVSGITFVAGVLILVVSHSFLLLIIGRLVQGIGIGIITIVIPLYLSETTPAKIRGRGVALFQLCLTAGILIGYVSNDAYKVSGSWRSMFSVSLVPALLFVFGSIFYLPKSPRWLCMRGRASDARKVLDLILGSMDDGRKELETSLRSMASASVARLPSWRLLLEKRYRRPLVTAVAIGILNQLTGTNVLLQFNATILSEAGLDEAILGSVYVGMAHFAMTFVALLLVDRVGRRPLLIVGTIGITCSLLFIAAVQLFTPTDSIVSGYGTLVGVIGFEVFFGVGPGVVVWLAVSEILPSAVRARGMSVALFANSMVSAMLAGVFMPIVVGVGYGGAFLMLAMFGMIYVGVAFFLMPEQSRRPLEDAELKTM